jgi:sensor histidine kinase YesM
MLRLYLDMERLRFKNSFDYSITTTNTVDVGAIYIPPLLLQPFCENAVWHGLMHKEDKGHLHISISEENKTLHCIITDDGIGREKAAALKSKSVEKEKSLGLEITTARLALLNGEKDANTFYQIEDVLDENGEVAGTRVILKIHFKDSVEELV